MVVTCKKDDRLLGWDLCRGPLFMEIPHNQLLQNQKSTRASFFMLHFRIL